MLNLPGKSRCFRRYVAAVTVTQRRHRFLTLEKSGERPAFIGQNSPTHLPTAIESVRFFVVVVGALLGARQVAGEHGEGVSWCESFSVLVIL